MTNREETGNVVRDIVEYLVRGISQEDREKFQASLEKWETRVVQVSAEEARRMRERFEEKKRLDDELIRELRDLLE